MKKIVFGLAIVTVLSISWLIWLCSIALSSENDDDIKTKIQQKFNSEYEKIKEELIPLGFFEPNSDFLARRMQETLFEKPFVKEEISRQQIAHKIADELIRQNTALLPEEEKIKRFLQKLCELAPEAGFLSPEENDQNYERFSKKPAVMFDFDKAGVIYIKIRTLNETFSSAYTFQDVFFPLWLKRDIFPQKILLDLRNCEGGNPKEAMKIAEIFYDVEFVKSKHQPEKQRTRFITPPKLFCSKYIRPLDCLDDLYESEKSVYFLNPLFLRIIEEKDSYFSYISFEEEFLFENGSTHYNYAMVKNNKIEEFKSVIDEFNTRMNSFNMVILVNQETKSAAELLSALLGQNRKITIIGEPTYGKIIMRSIYPLGYDIKSNKIKILEKYRPKLCRGHGFERLAPPDKNLDLENVIDLGVLALPNGYWYNPELKNDPRFKKLFDPSEEKKCIMPDIILNDEDHETDDDNNFTKDALLKFAIDYLNR